MNRIALCAFVCALISVAATAEYVASEIDIPEDLKWHNPAYENLFKIRPEGTDASARSDQRIVGGVPATPFEFPWLTSLRYKGSSSRYSRHFCGGSLIDKSFVFTAAHCSTGMSTSRVEIGVKNHDLSAPTTSEGETFEITKINIHPRYNSRVMVFDFAIWKLQGETTVTPISLITPESNITLPGTLATVAGWGTTSYMGSLSRVLLKTQVPIVDSAKCQQQLRTSITDSMICAGYDEGGKDTCQGDSGGPLFYPTENGPILAGDTSFGFGCASANSPGVYGRMTVALSYVDAILNGKNYVTINSASLTYSPSTKQLTFTTKAINLANGTPIKGADIVVRFSSKVGTAQCNEVFRGKTSSTDGSFSFKKAPSGAGVYYACVTQLSFDGFETDLSENCGGLRLN
eukprot:TRINITY_DN178_c0_g2_i2.p1 TRINITY_DN178_c0_g2~~TRINITY_DN178_c0_g2_i2.p1  ORF type:complete len:403 (-),score=88.13 TRINITY_DN178_c0_g2_i2:430-1638(-)